MAPSRSIPSLLHLLSSRSSRNPHSLPRCMSSLSTSSSAVCASPLRPSSSSSSSSSSSCFMTCESSGKDLRSALGNLSLVRKFVDHGGEDYSRLLAVGFASLATLSLGQLHQTPASSEKFVETEGTSVDALLTVHPENLAEAFLEELRAACDEDRVMLDLDERTMHGKPWNTYHVLKAIPDVVVYPKSQEEVVAVVNTCAKYKIPLTAYAGGTSLEGHTMTPYAGVTINMNLMKGVKELHLEDMDIVVEPGIGWIELNEFLKPHGLFFPLDPGPGASIGGMCATRCSGSLAVRYGTMRDNVISLKAVVANGDVVKTAARARKTAAGYDLTRLMIGSEGTLGIITEVTLRLQKIPEASTVAMCNFKNIRDAADVAIATMHSGIQVSRVELLDEVMMKAINMANDKSFTEEPTLMFEFIGTEASALEQTLRVQKLVEEHNGSDFVFADTPAEKEELWKLRKEAFWSTSALRPGAEALVTDVCVPLSRLAECISTSKEKLDASSLPCSILSHAGDGNFHVIILFDPQSQEEVREVSTLTTGMVHTALSMEGTCTGEHGIGIGKMKFLEEELGLEALMAMGKIKQALDPSNLMNPGKVIPERFCY